MASNVGICTSALLMIGADEITSFSDETREAKLCSSIYETYKNNALCSHYWDFCTDSASLNRLSESPLFGFAYAYQLPADYLRLLRKGSDTMKHSIRGNKLFTDLEAVNIEYQFKASETTFPDYFTLYLTLLLAEILSVALLDDVNKAAAFKEQARLQKIMAKSIDSQSSSDQTIPASKFSLTTIRN